MSDLNDFENDTPPRPDTPEDSDMGDGVRLISEDVSCTNCEHRGVCAVYKGIEPMFRDWEATEGKVPFELGELAVICGYYAPEEEDG